MFGLSVLHPWLLGGTLLIAAPILIHLFNQRRFQILNWAAMEFLLEADRRNRRRIRLENLLLLILRCLAILLIALLVSRPVIQPGALAAVVPGASVERIVIVDDSPSMDAVAGNKTPLNQAAESLAGWVRELARQRPGDSLTLLLTSRPERPLYNAEPLGGERTAAIAQTLETLKPADLPANYARSLTALEELLRNRNTVGNHAIYIATDLRAHDWAQVDPTDKAPQGLAASLGRLSERAQSLTLADFGQVVERNLGIVNIVNPQASIAAGVEARFEVVVANHGDAPADEVEVVFRALGGPERRARISSIAPHSQAAASFTYLFKEPGPMAVEADIPADALRADNARYFAGQVVKGTSVLLVDGDPAADAQRSETYFLGYALNPPGELPSGNVVETITEGQLESAALDRYQLIVLANVYRLGPERVAALRQWVEGGGGLVIFLGDQVDAEAFNRDIVADGAGLCALPLLEVRGDAQGEAWVNFNPQVSDHPVLRLFSGTQNPFLRTVKIFRYWVGEPLKSAPVGRFTVLATYTDPQNSPAVIEQSIGQGRVILFTTTADTAWTNWPRDPSYAGTMLALARHAARPQSGQMSMLAGQTIQYELDPSRYQPEVRVTAPGDVPVGVTAVAENNGRMFVRFDETRRVGLYNLELAQLDGGKVVLPVAVNLDPAEGDLRRAMPEELRRQLNLPTLNIVPGGQAFHLTTPAAVNVELWRPVLLALVVVLGVEQFLAWTFGRRR